MKNLELIYLNHHYIENNLNNTTKFSQALILPEDPSNLNKIYLINDGKLLEYYWNEKRFSPPLIDQEFYDVIGIKVLPIDGQIHIITNTELFVVNVNTNERDSADSKLLYQVEFEDFLETVEWSPTDEHLVGVAGNGNVYVIPCWGNYELSYKQCSNVEDKIPDTVYVGWGSENTQFRGSEGKLKNKIQQVEVEPIIYGKPTITWRGNGEMFAVNYWKDNKRLFTVFKNNGNALYRSENCPGLQSPIAWRPTGNMIATITKTDKKRVVIFEKNGQKRFNFDIDCEDDEIEELKWSPCAKVLAILTKNNSKQSLRLWTCSNYQWYQKQHLEFHPDNPLLHFEWMQSTFATFNLRVITKNYFITYSFSFKVNEYNEQAICAVINGKNLQITDYKDAIIPPPLYAKSITTVNDINCVFFNNNNIYVLNSKNIIEIYDLNNYNKISELNLEEMIDSPKIPLIYHGINSGIENTEISLITYNNDCNIIKKYLDYSTKNIVRQNDYEINSSIVESRDKDDNNFILTTDGQLRNSDTLISSNVNSFIIFDEYLLFTTKLNELHCIKYKDLADMLRQNNRKLIYRRNIEQGAILICGIPNTPKLILQMPRGNIETISCRIIAIDILDRMLEKNLWNDSIIFIKTEKLNSNLLFDLNPERFLSNIEQFIIATSCVELNRICLEFEECNVLNTIYRPGGNAQNYSNKLQTIFKKILNYFDQKDYIFYITTIMVINYHFFTLKDALIYLQDLYRRCIDVPSLEHYLKDAVNTLKIYGADEKLYDTALSLYDLDLAKYLAGYCQIDPRIYEPQLLNLKNLNEIERRYEINIYLKNYKIAARYLLKNQNIPVEKIESFIETHRISREAYENISKKSPHFQLISRLYASELSRKNHHREAGIVFERAGLYGFALEQFKMALGWRECLELSEKLNMTDDDKKKMLVSLAQNLSQNRQSIEAAVIFEEHLKDFQMAVQVLILNQKFVEALHIVKKHKLDDTINKKIIEAVQNHHQYLKDKIEELHGTFTKFRNRLKIVWEKRTEKKSHHDEEDDDLFSDAGSIISSRSNTSSRSKSSTLSSKNRRKEERKKQDLREGGAYEDIAIIRAVYAVIAEIYNKKDDVKETCLLLLRESDMEFKQIKDLIVQYQNVESDVKKGVGEIWPACFFNKSESPDIKEIAILENFDQLDVQFRRPPDVPNDWKLEIFK